MNEFRINHPDTSGRKSIGKNAVSSSFGESEN